MVDDVLAAHQIAAERAGVTLRAVLPTEPVQVIGSDRALVRVLSNLVANAIAHTPSGGTVDAGDRCRRRTARGPAWTTPASASTRRTCRGCSTWRTAAPTVGCHGSDPSLPSGSGLGLAIAAGLVQAHHGTLSAHNLGTGARFEVRLPLAD